jgi:membrane associated rhomboid family serine protease
VGIYDRDYYRRSQPGFSLRMPQSMVITLIIINVALYLIDGLLFPRDHFITEHLALTEDTLWHPWLWWQFITYGFVHSPQPMHIIANMIGLFFLGRYVEQLYGPKEFLRVYLLMILFGSLAFVFGTSIMDLVNRQETPYTLLGASGAVTGITILFVLNFPQVTLVLFPIPIPVKAWVIGALLVVYNVFGTIAQTGSNIAFGVHLAGIVFGALYFRYHWNLGRFFEKFRDIAKYFTRPKFRIHEPDDEEDQGAENELNAEVDRILAKISREGESSLTRKERRTLETASRQYQHRRR